MFSGIFKRIRRTPFRAVGTMVFATVLAVVLCVLNSSKETEQQHYEEIYRNTPVKIEVTDLFGIAPISLNAQGWWASLFIGDGSRLPSLDMYVKDLQIVGHIMIQGEATSRELYGATSFGVLEYLQPDYYNCTISWEPGYDESIFEGNESVCIAPEWAETTVNELTGMREISMDFSSMNKRITRTFTVVGTFTNENYYAESEFYFCPYSVVNEIWKKLETDEILVIKSISAQISDNDYLEEFREKAKAWFAEPNPLGEKTSWNRIDYEYYPYALRIDDSLLKKSESALQSSMLLNGICTALVFAFSVGTGFFVGFLMVRQRKHEIALMRILGTGKLAIYINLALEQMLCIGVGTVLAGLFFERKPLGQLVLLDAVYFGGLTVALLVFLHRNLLTTGMEEE